MVSGNKPSVSMALIMDSLRELSDSITSTRHTLDDLTRQRDDLLCQMKEAGIPDRSLMRLTGLSRTQITRITTNTRRSSAALRTAELVSGTR